MNKYIAITLSLILVFSMCTGVTFAYTREEDISVYYNDIKLEFDQEPTVINNRTMVPMVPMRAIFEAFGMEVSWYSEAKKVIVKNDSLTIELVIGSKTACVNGKSTDLDVFKLQTLLQ